MVTLVGTQNNFADALRELAELEYDAIEAYKIAVDKLKTDGYVSKLREFLADHNRHVQVINDILTSHNEKIVTGPSAKQWLTKGKVYLGNLLGDESILSAMLSNEGDTNSAYEKILDHESRWHDTVEFLKQALEDERRHKKWLHDTCRKS